ncbi:MAG: protease modulator HflK N-terminal domain-containing protein, partial [Marinobacter salsuginis]
MAWNEPGGNRNDNDPWGTGGGRRGNDQGPPDLDEAFKKLQDKLNGMFGGGGNSGGNSGKSADVGGGFIAMIFVVIVVVWGALGIYQVD